MDEASVSEPSTASKPTVAKLPCSVCHEPGDGLHFGAEACRACAAFFRRTVALQKVYYCKSNGTCEINSNVRSLCRLCRYQKCLHVGMRKTSVQKYRENRENRDDSGESSCPSPEGVSEVEMYNLMRLKECYKTMDEARNFIHKRGSDSVFHKPSPMNVNYKTASDVNVKEFGALADFVMNSFPLLGKLDIVQQRKLFKHFFLPFMLLESGYFCSVLERADLILLGSGDFIDTSNTDYFYHETGENSLMSGSEAAKAMAPSFDIIRRNILQPMIQLKVDETEFLALCAFSMWDTGIEGQSEECEMLASRVREKMTAELVFYYRSIKKLREPAERLSALMLILPPLQRAICRFRQDAEMSRFFSYDIDDQFYNIINGHY